MNFSVPFLILKDETRGNCTCLLEGNKSPWRDKWLCKEFFNIYYSEERIPLFKGRKDVKISWSNQNLERVEKRHPVNGFESCVCQHTHSQTGFDADTIKFLFSGQEFRTGIPKDLSKTEVLQKNTFCCFVKWQNMLSFCLIIVPWALTNSYGTEDPHGSETRIMVMSLTGTSYVSQSCGLQQDTQITSKETANQFWLTTKGFLKPELTEGNTPSKYLI